MLFIVLAFCLCLSLRPHSHCGECERGDGRGERLEEVRSWLGVPYFKQVEIRRQSSTEREKSLALGDYWVNTDPDASWEVLSRRLYQWGEGSSSSDETILAARYV